MKSNHFAHKLLISIWDLLFLLNVPISYNQGEVLFRSQRVRIRKVTSIASIFPLKQKARSSMTAKTGEWLLGVLKEND